MTLLDILFNFVMVSGHRGITVGGVYGGLL